MSAVGEVAHICHALDRLGRERGERSFDMAIAIALTLFYLDNKETDAGLARARFMARAGEVCDVIGEQLIMRTLQ